MTRIYAIHTGAYSDQSWGPVFSTVEKALAYIDSNKQQFDDPRVEVHVLDNENDTGPVYARWAVVFDKDGNALRTVKRWEPQPYEPLADDTSIEVKPIPKVCNWYYLNGLPPDIKGTGLCVDYIPARDEAHALKIAVDKRFQYRATH